MQALATLALVIVISLLVWDWLTKRRRLRHRSEISDEEFLGSYRQSTGRLDLKEEILTLRQQVAKELGFPPAKLSPLDSLTELRDRYCLVISGHLALGDLLNDLHELRERSGLPELKDNPITVGQYIGLALEAERSA